MQFKMAKLPPAATIKSAVFASPQVPAGLGQLGPPPVTHADSKSAQQVEVAMQDGSQLHPQLVNGGTEVSVVPQVVVAQV